MNIYKDLQNKIHVLEDSSFEYLLPQGCIAITDVEAEAIRVASIPVPTFTDIENTYLIAIQDFMDSAAKAKGYDNIISASSYAGAPNPFQAESISFLVWRATVWEHCYSLLDSVKAGTIPMPTIQEVISGLPVRI